MNTSEENDAEEIARRRIKAVEKISKENEEMCEWTNRSMQASAFEKLIYAARVFTGPVRIGKRMRIVIDYDPQEKNYIDVQYLIPKSSLEEWERFLKDEPRHSKGYWK